MINKKILIVISLLLVSFLLVGCMLPKQNLPPEITSDPVKTATVGVDYTYNVVATDPNAGDVLTYSLTGEPDGMLINPDSGKITWTPTTVGSVEFTVIVTDDKGLFDTQDVTITVSEFMVELIGIEVDPEEMTLPLYGIGTLEVTAYYNDDTTPVVTSECDYGSSNNSIAKVNDVGEVNALAEGTATITVTYEDKTDTIEVTVGDFVAMEIIADDVLTFTAGATEAKEFTASLVANSDVDKNALCYFTLPAGTTFEYYEVDPDVYPDGLAGWKTLTPTDDGYVFGPAEGFPLEDITIDFRAKFTTAETFLMTVEIWSVEDELLGFKTITVVVE